MNRPVEKPVNAGQVSHGSPSVNHCAVDPHRIRVGRQRDWRNDITERPSIRSVLRGTTHADLATLVKGVRDGLVPVCIGSQIQADGEPSLIRILVENERVVCGQGMVNDMAIFDQRIHERSVVATGAEM